jgi:DNA-binding beta-propeller fold protein YncE
VRRLFVLSAVTAAAMLAAGCSSESSPGGLEAALEITPGTGTVITDFVCDASGSSVGGRSLECRWDWESDGTWDTDWSTELTVEHRFASGDTITVTVEVRDGDDTDQAADAVLLDTRHGAVVRDLIPSGPAARALGCDGVHLWTANWGDRLIRKLDPATGDTVDTFRGPSQWPCGIAWDGLHLWIVDYLNNMRMFEVDPVTGDTLSSFLVEYSSFPAGAAWHGDLLYEGVYAGRVNVYTTDGDPAGSFISPRGLTTTGLAHDGVNLWVACGTVDSVYAVDPEDGTVRFSRYVEGLTHDIAVDDEGYLWAARSGQIARIVP